MKFGIVLKNLMEEQQITQCDLANKIGYTQRAISKWINLQSEPSETAILKVSKYFNVSVDYLLGRTDELGGIIPERSPALQLTEDEKNLLENFRRMDHSQKIRLEAYIDGLLGNDAAAKRKL